MNINISGRTPNPIAATAPYKATALPPTSLMQAAKPAAAGTVEISSGARQAYSAGHGQAPPSKMKPLNIIWGNSPK